MTASADEVQEFIKGEKVLSYEPDPSKTTVLWESKVLAVYERRDEQGLKYFLYKIHFQGWNLKWDRAVRADQLLKYNEENLKLQRELAEASQLEISGSYSYKDTKTPTGPPSKKKRLGKGIAHGEEYTADPLDISPVRGQRQPQQHELPRQQKGSGSGNRSRDNSGGRKTQHAQGDGKMKGQRNAVPAEVETVDNIEVLMENEKYVPPEERVMLRLSERLREYMEYDFNMIVKLGKQHALPARMPIVTILEAFVKQRAVELAISIKQDSTRARNTQSRNARMVREFDRVMANVCLLKEIVDGLRICFEFYLDDHLLYKEEREHASSYLTDENMKYCCEILNKSYDYINPHCDTELIALDGTPVAVGDVTTTNGGDTDGGIILDGLEYEKELQKCLQYIDKRNGKNTTANAYNKRTSPYFAAYNLPVEMRDFLCTTFSWHMLLPDSPPEKSMIFGAPHLARLLVKLPEYLNAMSFTNEKLAELLKHLDMFINFLENHKEWFDKDNYVHETPRQDQLQKELLESLKHSLR